MMAEVPPAFRSILCAVDGSPESQEAARQAVTLAADGASLTFIAVPESGLMHDDAARRVLAGAVELAEREGISAASELGELDGISQAVEERSSGRDLLVVGSHGTSRREGIVWGSTASLAAHIAPVPVLVARRPPEGQSFVQRILVASDGSSDSVKAVDLAARLARDHGSTTWLVNVGEWEDPQHRHTFSEQAVDFSEVTGGEPVEWRLGESRSGAFRSSPPRSASP